MQERAMNARVQKKCLQKCTRHGSIREDTNTNSVTRDIAWDKAEWH